MRTLEERLTPLAKDLARTQEQIAMLTEITDVIKGQIRELVPGPDKYKAGRLTVVVTTNRRFDARKAAALVPDDMLPDVADLVVNRTKLEVRAPQIAAASFTDYQLKVGIQ